MSMNILDIIVSERREAVAEARRRLPVERLRDEASTRRHHSLVDALRTAESPRVIAEIKQASPSAGRLRTEYYPGKLARGYEVAGAAAISVLTEPRRFLGCESHLREVRASVELPVLRKDFLCDPYQVAEAAAWGADVILLIVAAVPRNLLDVLHGTARDMGLDVLVESHTEAELDVALELPGAVVGVNSRNLKTLETDLSVARDMASAVPEGRLAVAESGIRTGEDIADLWARGYRGFLVGETLMRDPDPGACLRGLLAGGSL